MSLGSPSLIRLGPIFTGIILLMAGPLAAEEQLANGGFDEWADGKPVSWNRVSNVACTEVPLGDGNSAVQLGTSSAEATQALIQNFTSTASGFVFRLVFTQVAPAANSRGMNFSLRAGGNPLLSFRSNASGTLETYNGTTAAWVQVGGTSGAIAPASYADGNLANDPLYELEVEGDLATARYSVRLYHVSAGTLISSVSGMEVWQSTPTAASRFNALHLERGRGQTDWRAYEASLDDVATPDPFVVNPDPPHPFLIVSAGEYEDWRQRALHEPWATVKTKTLATAATLVYDPAFSGPYRSKVLRLKTVVSACALASILDPANTPAYATKAAGQMIAGLTDIRDTRVAAGGWDANTPVGSTLFSCILALDVLHSHIDPATRAQIEGLIGPLANAISGWNPSPASVRCLWALYRGDAAAYQSNVSAYLSQLLVYFTEDGVMIAGTGYGNARMNYYDREQKHALVDVLARLGAVDGYSIAKLRRMYEWLYGSAYGHQGELHIFGDTSPNRPLWGPPGEYPEDSPTAAYAAWHFSSAAQSYANRLIADPAPQPSLLAYALLGTATRDLPARNAPSRIFKSGGAFFREATLDPDGLSSGMLNLTASEGHTHKETNSLSLIGYGENLISNSGYAGYASTSLTYSWDYINNRAISANTVLIDYPLTVARTATATGDHVLKYGSGITRGLLTPELDYAVGDSGSAIAKGTHQRGIAFVQPDATAGLPGYWILMDEVVSATGTTAHMALHPFSADATTTEAGARYRWYIKRDTAQGCYLSIYLGSPPSQTQLLDGVFANLDPAKSFIGKFLYATYPIPSGTARFASAIVPRRAAAEPAAVIRSSGTGYHAMELGWAGTTAVDRIFTADGGGGPLTSGAIIWEGTGCYVREKGGALERFLVDRGLSFSRGGTEFTSTVSSVAIGDTRGLAISIPSAALVTVRQPGVTRVFLDHSPSPIFPDGGGRFTVTLAAGSHQIRFNAPAKPSLHLSMTADTAILGIEGLQPGLNYRHETSVDLIHWEVLKDGPPPGTTDIIADPLDSPRRFYRTVPPEAP